MAGRFSFSLQRMLDYRMQLEDQAKFVMAQAQRAHQAAAQVIETLSNTLQTHEASLHGQSEILANDMWLWRQYQSRLHDDIEAAKQQLFSCAKELTAAREDLLKKSKERKILEKMRDKQKQDFYAQQRKQEQQETDEMAGVHHQNIAF